MSLSDTDRQLLDRCLSGSPRAWEDFVDRFLGLVVHVAHHTAHVRNKTLQPATRDDFVADVFLEIVANDHAVLQRFQRNCSLATYLTVIARRVIVRKMASDRSNSPLSNGAVSHAHHDDDSIARFENVEEVRSLMMRLDPQEARVVQMYHLEGKSYQQISQEVGLSENSIGPVLTRARSKMRERSDN